MRIIIGIIIGVFIVFNWGAIEDYFDHKISSVTEVSTKSSDKNIGSESDSSSRSDPKKSDQQQVSNSAEEKGSDSFKDFK